MQKILVFAGVKQSHKSTSCKYITASRMKRAGIIKSFHIDDEGDLIVPISDTENTTGVLDLKRTDNSFAQYAYENIWPHAKIYSFADELKLSAINIFGLNPKFIYGTDKDKETQTSIRWKDIARLLTPERYEQVRSKVNQGEFKSEFLSHRELLQEFGTLCRAFKPDCWIESCWNKIKDENWPFVLIDDCRYENEIDYSKQEGANIVLLTLQPFKDSHSSELIHNVDKSKFDYILDNAKMSFEQKNIELEKILIKFGWTTTKL